MRLKAALFFSCLAAIPAVSSLAQSNDAHTFTASNHSQSVSDGIKEDIGDIHEEGEGGLLSFFHGNVSARGEYVSNAKLQGNHSSGDFLFFPTLVGGFTVPMGYGVTLDVSAKVESVVYSRYDDRGF